MKIVGLTGGIGSGKTTVAKLFKELGVPIYIADDEAKALMNRSKVIRRKLVALFGEEAYIDDSLNRPYLAQAIFNNHELLSKMNAIVHPKVAKHFQRWVSKQDAPYVIKEAAILFENGSYTSCDYIIVVTAPKALKIERVLKRDNTSKSKIKAIMNNQWDDKEKIKLSNFQIENIDIEDTKKAVVKLHKKLLKKIT